MSARWYYPKDLCGVCNSMQHDVYDGECFRCYKLRKTPSTISPSVELIPANRSGNDRSSVPVVPARRPGGAKTVPAPREPRRVRVRV